MKVNIEIQSPSVADWTPEQKAHLVKLVDEKVAEQIIDDPQIRAVADWMITSVGLQPNAETYRLVFLVTCVTHIASGT